MADKTDTERQKTANKRKRLIKLAAVLALFTVVIVVFAFAWFTYFRMDEVDGLSFKTVGREDIETDMNAYYMEDGDDSWTELSDGIEFIPQDYLTVKFVLSNKTDKARDFSLDYESLQVKYYKIQPFLAGDWTADTDGYWYKGTDEFGYSKDYVMAGEYVDADKNILDYHTVSTADYMKLLKPATNAIRYCVSNISAVTAGADDSETAANAKNMSLTSEQKANIKNAVKTESVLCETDAQDLTVLNTSDPVDVVARSSESKQLVNVLDPSDSGDNYIKSDGTIHINEQTVVVVYMTLYFDPNIYSSAEIGGKTVTLENSNPFMYQYVYLNKIKMSPIL